MTLFALQSRDELLAVRFACSPVWETQAAVRMLADRRVRTDHEPWRRVVRGRTVGIDLAPLHAVLSHRDYVPDFLTPPPRTARPRLRDELAEIRSTSPVRVRRELELCRETAGDLQARRLLDTLLADPVGTRDLLANRLQEAWNALVVPFWVRIRTLLDHDIERRSATIARHGYGRALEELHPRIRWTKRGLSCADRSGRTVEVDKRGLVLMPSAFLSPYVAAVVDEPWLPTIVYPAHGLAELWRIPSAPPDALARLLGRRRALVLASLDPPRSTTALAALIELSPAGTSRHLLALRDAGLVTTRRHGHEVRYSRTPLGSAVLHHRRPAPR